MKNLKRYSSLLLVLTLTFSLFSNVALAQTANVIPRVPTQEMIEELDAASTMLGEGIISEEEYISMLIDIYKLSMTRSDDYYPEIQTGYIDPEGVEYLYEEGLRNADTAQAAIVLLMNLLPGAGWGLSAIAVIAAYGGKSALEKAVDQAYFSGKGIYIYYQIHKSIQSMNRVRYVVG